MSNWISQNIVLYIFPKFELEHNNRMIRSISWKNICVIKCHIKWSDKTIKSSLLQRVWFSPCIRLHCGFFSLSKHPSTQALRSYFLLLLWLWGYNCVYNYNNLAESLEQGFSLPLLQHYDFCSVWQSLFGPYILTSNGSLFTAKNNIIIKFPFSSLWTSLTLNSKLLLNRTSLIWLIWCSLFFYTSGSTLKLHTFLSFYQSVYLVSSILSDLFV